MLKCLASLMLALPLCCFAQNRVVAEVYNFPDDKGLCKACLFANAQAFEKEQPLRCVAVAVAGKKAQAVFADVPDGSYAVFVIHDRNNNGKLDTNFLGIPKEGYGASNNKLPFAAAPKFDANRFAISGGNTVTLNIRLRNL